jgi:SAM-dependent methyltransferase
VSNVVYIVDDAFANGFGGKPASKDACLLFNILHCAQPVRLLAQAARVVRPAGFVHVIHWRYDPATPRGPRMDIRPRPEQILNWAGEAVLLASPEGVLDLPPWHYGIRFQHSFDSVQ